MKNLLASTISLAKEASIPRATQRTWPDAAEVAEAAVAEVAADVVARAE
jgi:hypothetical protein